MSSPTTWSTPSPRSMGSLGEVPGADEMFGEDAGEDVPGAHR